MGERRGSIKGMTADEARGALTPQQVDDFQAAFNIFDSDGGGEISTRELLKVFKMLGFTPTKDELDEIVEVVDQDGSGEIDFDEFLIMMVMQIKEEGKSGDEAVLKDAFRILDADKDSYLSFEEISGAFANTSANPSAEEIRLLYDDSNKKGDGKLDMDEFLQALQAAGH